MLVKLTLNQSRLFLIVPILFICFVGSAQSVGINTTTPNGVLDINSANSGFVLPRVVLTSTVLQAPIVNPQGGNIPQGTTVYNTSTTSTGANDVFPGMYVWSGTQWQSQFEKKQRLLYEQSSLDMLTSASSSFTNVTGLSSKTFTPDYTGFYKVSVNVNFAGGNAKVPKISGGNPSTRSNGYLNIARASGTFRLNLAGTNYDIPVNSYSTAYEPSESATNYFAIWQEFSTVIYLPCIAGSSKSFTLSFDQHDAPEFLNDGNSSSGRGHIGYDIPCTVEITYVGE
ncbi:hypothetical protein [Ulvibacter antarcticus]|nr:hypothetical protein [Ulvibacter antarcticus]